MFLIRTNTKPILFKYVSLSGCDVSHVIVKHNYLVK